jgi:hypothetical protein
VLYIIGGKVIYIYGGNKNMTDEELTETKWETYEEEYYDWLQEQIWNYEKQLKILKRFREGMNGSQQVRTVKEEYGTTKED